MPLTLITAPESEPVTLAEAKAHMRVTHDDEDTLITALIAAAREACEQKLGRALITQTWEKVLDAFPENEIRLPWPPLISITSVKYIDTSGAQQTLAADVYTIDADSEPGWLLLADGETWPETLDVANAVRVRYSAGYGAAGAVPQSIKAWLLLKIAELYEHREASSEKPASAHGFVDGLLDRYRILEIA